MSEPSSSYHRAYYYEKPSCFSRACTWFFNIVCCLIPLSVIAYFIWDRLGRPSAKEAFDMIKNIDASDFTHVLGNLTQREWDRGFNEDPFVGDNSSNVWIHANGYGLTLELFNALDDSWQTEFSAAVNDWQEAEALDLSTTRVDVDHTCKPVDGIMKVCNGNFGPTGWLGINEMQIQYMSANDPGVIVNSVAKMNEYYLYNAEYSSRQYTMCHEIGHGFGLPHTDENMYNADMGNCLDYTSTPANNMHPGQVNFNRLGSMYIAGYNDNNNVQEEQYNAGNANENGYNNEQQDYYYNDDVRYDDQNEYNNAQQQQEYNNANENEYNNAQQEGDYYYNDDFKYDDENDDNGNNRRFLRRVVYRHYLYV